MLSEEARKSGRSDVKRRTETGGNWHQAIETIPKNSLYGSCSKGEGEFPVESLLSGVFVVKVAAGEVSLVGLRPTRLMQ
ncbi:uncharacterized protein N7518_001239 [Penicillium psychrosexuale]|uniref:uncharacterized protein n=1 Tax=Penicillium psychrosexuale TaxID=1002107 RepID=UPI002545051B|nr:uncharacterized protein N7518_001239 [Penicillium psychrosexuale]KAJ5799171.1 hypothetical protein N7518_001239 [Penicillium psychrosexuale]